MLTHAEARLLDDISDDDYALWEVNAGFDRDAPRVDRAARIAVIGRLLERGLVELRVGLNWEQVRQAAPLQTADAINAISSASSWKMPSGEAPIYALAISPAGNAERMNHRR